MNTRDELQKILAAINSRDEKNFLARVDLKQLTDIAYDEERFVLQIRLADSAPVQR